MTRCMYIKVFDFTIGKTITFHFFFGDVLVHASILEGLIRLVVGSSMPSLARGIRERAPSAVGNTFRTGS
jgi:hypothetical protein